MLAEFIDRYMYVEMGADEYQDPAAVRGRVTAARAGTWHALSVAAVAVEGDPGATRPAHARSSRHRSPSFVGGK